MKWTEEQVTRLRELCSQGKGNSEIAASLHCRLSDVYAKRSQLGITIQKCKGIAPNPEFEKVLAPAEETDTKTKGMRKSVKDAFKELNNALLLAMASDWTSIKDAQLYAVLANSVDSLRDAFDQAIGGS